LIEEAGNLFYRNGFQAVGLDQVMDAVGISKTGLYKHFESKDDLIVAVLVERDKRDIAEMEQFIIRQADGDPLGQVVAMFDQLDVWFQDPEFRGCLFMNAATEFPSRHDPIHRAAEAHRVNVMEMMRNRLERARFVDAEQVAEQIMQVMTGAIIARHTRGAMEAAQVAKGTVARMIGAEQGVG
jgi:AcrR family transcriptional regulator